jgi:biofilm PGA synthesis N-glycosyltransferase PgaC
MSRVALGSAALLAYAFVGYPVALAVLARRRGEPHRGDPGYLPRVSVLVPVFDGERYVGPKLESLLAQDYPRERLEILVYSDGSTDGTAAAVERFAERGVALVRGGKREGKPTALNALRARATGEVLVLTDVRQPLDPGAVRALVGHLADPSIGCVSGALVVEGARGSSVYWAYESFLRVRESRRFSMVGATGPLYALRASDMPEVPVDVVLDDVWIPMQLVLRGKRAILDERARAHDVAFDDGRERQRKARTIAGMLQLLERMPELLDWRRNPAYFELVSHKVLRLASPLLLGALAASTARAAWAREAGTARTLGRATLAAIAAGSALALLGERAGRVGRVARTSAMLQGAAIEGAWRWLRGSQGVRW